MGRNVAEEARAPGQLTLHPGRHLFVVGSRLVDVDDLHEARHEVTTGHHVLAVDLDEFEERLLDGHVPVFVIRPRCGRQAPEMPGLRGGANRRVPRRCGRVVGLVDDDDVVARQVGLGRDAGDESVLDADALERRLGLLHLLAGVREPSDLVPGAAHAVARCGTDHGLATPSGSNHESAAPLYEERRALGLVGSEDHRLALLISSRQRRTRESWR